MRRLIIANGDVVRYVDEKIGGREHLPCDAFSIGMLDDKGQIVGGVVFTGFDGIGITLHSAGASRMWLDRTFLRAIFSYPFKQLGCARLSTIVREDNKPAQTAALKAGFKFEGILRKAEPDGCGLIIYGMLKEECRWLEA